MSFCQLQQFQCLHHGSTKAYHCSPLGSIFYSTAAKVKICSIRIMASVQDLVSAMVAGAHLTLFFAWNVAQSVQSSWK